MLYLGIDQHRKHLTVNVRDESGTTILKRQISTAWEKVRAFFEDLRQQSADQGGFCAILEVCGFNDWLLKMLKEYGCRQIVVVQPTHRQCKKTDRRDAHALGELLWVNRQRLLAGQVVQGLRRVVLPEPWDAQNRQLTMRRKQLGQLRTRTINRVQHILLKHNLQQDCPTKGLDTQAARRWLKALPLDEIDRMEMDQLLEQWELWDRQLQQLEDGIGRRQREDERAACIASIPGAGAYTSLALASRVGDIRRFRHPGSLANYWGLTPGCRNSGDKTNRLGSITKQGSAVARFILGQLTTHVLRRDRRMKPWYQRIKKRRGAKIARVAVMRRLATIIWHMLQYDEAYDPRMLQRRARLGLNKRGRPRPLASASASTKG